eukprot:TRINITY_DN20049_c0_g1_i1.p1 TRINITY_DN20049_c0_g1~~TRINITY_DN20049_c0_g1_i1.p1  ORF type:complete len:155 (+),score=37.00 TRINITY_DN20049_c0_g1_i1:174-638(+)
MCIRDRSTQSTGKLQESMAPGGRRQYMPSLLAGREKQPNYCCSVIGGIMAWFLLCLSMVPMTVMVVLGSLVALCGCCYRRPAWCPRSISREALWELEDKALSRYKRTRRQAVVLPCGVPVSYTHLRAHETPEHLVCRLLLEKKKAEEGQVRWLP